MKKCFYRIGFIATAVLALIGCAKELEEPVEKGGTHTVQVTLSKPEGTKTAVTEGQGVASYKWTTGDEGYLHVYENDVEGEISGISYSSDMTTATLSVTFTGTPSAPYVYTAKYFSKKSSGGNPLIINEQNPKADSFDPAADVLISKEITSADTRLSSLQFIMGRVVTVNKMTLTGLAAGEKVSKVEVTFDKSVSAYFIGPENYSSNGMKLTLKYKDAPLTVPANGQVSVYFVAAPIEDAAFKSVVVTTDTNVYTKSDELNPNPFLNPDTNQPKTISFAVGTMTRFSMAMGDYGAPIGDEVKYYKVTDADQIIAGGVYLITSTKADNSVVAMGAYNSSKYYEAVDVAVTSDQTNGDYIKITSEDVTPVILESIESSFYIKDPDGNYFYWSSGNTIERGNKDNNNSYKWTIGKEEIVNVGDNTRKLQYNSGSPRFACYSSAQKSIALYVKEGSLLPRLDQPANVNANVEGTDIHVTWSDISAPTGVTVTYIVTCTGQATKTIAQGVGSCSFEDLEDGSYVVTVSAHPSTQNYQESFAVSIGDLAVETALAYYVKVSSGLSDWSGVYLIVNENNSVAFDGSLSDLDSTPNTFGVVISNNKILAGASVDSKSFTITAMDGGYSIQASTGKYIGRNANSNGLDSGNNALLNTIAWTSNHPVITAKGGRTLGFNADVNQKKFRYMGTSDIISLFKLEDNRTDSGMNWSASAATASWDTGNTVSGFTAPTLTPGNATDITYESSNAAVATINASGVVNIVGPGETTISAIFAGNAAYKPQTVSYTLTVSDNRDLVATPSISPAAGSVVSGTEVTITCANEGAAIYYTLDGSTPTIESAVYTDAIILTASKTVKAIAVKDGYKDSSVATAEYVVTGVDVVVLNEEFDNNSTSDSTAAINSNTFPNFNGTTDKAYKSKFGGIKLGSSSAVGYITSKSLDLSKRFTVKINVMKYGSDTGMVKVTVGSVSKTITPTDVDTAFSLDFDAATSSSTVKIETTSKRAYIDNVVITRHD